MLPHPAKAEWPSSWLLSPPRLPPLWEMCLPQLWVPSPLVPLLPAAHSCVSEDWEARHSLLAGSIRLHSLLLVFLPEEHLLTVPTPARNQTVQFLPLHATVPTPRNISLLSPPSGCPCLPSTQGASLPPALPCRHRHFLNPKHNRAMVD